MVHILDTLTRLENKFDNLSLGHSNASTPDMLTRSTNNYPSSQSSGKIQRAGEDLPQDFPVELQRSYQHLTVPHKVILWPSIYIHLINSGIGATSDLQFILQEGTPWFIRQEMAKHPLPLPFDAGLPSVQLTEPSEGGYSSRTAFPTLTVPQIQEYADAYFNTFNVLCPILNQDAFMEDVVARLVREGYADGDPSSVLALMVFALGKVAVDGVFGQPISVLSNSPSGFRGGTMDKPPGIEIFNEARRRLGFVMTLCSLENVQILLLQATYYEANARHLDFWRCTVAASMACQVLVRCQSIDWSSQEGDMIKRAYWACILSEDLYHLDLDLPQTGIHTLEDEVPLPYFHEAQELQRGAGRAVDERSHFQYHFLAMIALRRLIARIHGVIHECTSSLPRYFLLQWLTCPQPLPHKLSHQTTTAAHQSRSSARWPVSSTPGDHYFRAHCNGWTATCWIFRTQIPPLAGRTSLSSPLIKDPCQLATGITWTS